MNVPPEIAFSSSNSTLPYDAVIFTTEDMYNEYTSRKLKYFRSMMDLFSRYFRVRFVIFSGNENIKKQFNGSNCLVEGDFARNTYGIPIINSLFSTAHHLFYAKYYGYVNSDILLHPHLFRVLSYLNRYTRSESLYSAHELAGRVVPVEYESFPRSFCNLTVYEEFFRTATQKRSLRGKYSAVVISL